MCIFFNLGKIKFVFVWRKIIPVSLPVSLYRNLFIPVQNSGVSLFCSQNPFIPLETKWYERSLHVFSLFACELVSLYLIIKSFDSKKNIYNIKACVCCPGFRLSYKTLTIVRYKIIITKLLKLKQIRYDCKLTTIPMG